MSRTAVKLLLLFAPLQLDSSVCTTYAHILGRNVLEQNMNIKACAPKRRDLRKWQSLRK